ncbi:T9SS type A sorting domain-containing protein [Chryseobacterium sp. JUb7]|uniref:T9SS type A sorting domain-containing protein n=1 Tax=Chryseobacterium sp. JUb7 TaxID=2940599 RepID=UPI0021695729|nr:T9SS type A sorting domain-containing protein [Chryseobacterium sp. JUb7]MCS3530652.1 putative delta-60 repeat protein [Chryseobacterium sp. JUb7]
MMKRFLLCLMTCATVLVAAQNQFLDPTFGTNGVVTYTPNNTYGFVYDAGALTSQQKIIVSGSYTSPNTPSNYRTNVVQRLNGDGSIDNTFSTLVMPPNNMHPYSQFTKMCIQSDQKIILCDLLFNKIIRLNENGIYDTAFGSNGSIDKSVLNQFFSTRNISAFNVKNIVLSSSNKLLICFSALENQEDRIGVIRLNENGTFDTSFGNNGVILEEGTNGDVLLQNDNKLVIVGQKQYVTFIKKRYSENGVLDNTYNNSSIPYTPLSGYGTYFITSVARNNMVYLYGFSSSATNPTLITLMKLDQNGELDSGFGTNGIVNEPYYNNNNNYVIDSNILYPQLLLDGNNDVFLACNVSPTASPVNYNHFVKKFKPNGTVDQNFGNNGVVDIELNYSEYIRSALVTNDNKIITFGHHQSPNKGIITKILNNNNVLAVNNINKEAFKIHPNPVEDFININTSGNNKFLKAEVLDLSGRIILTTEIKNNKIDVKNLQKGVYFLKVDDITTKIIKK